MQLRHGLIVYLTHKKKILIVKKKRERKKWLLRLIERMQCCAVRALRGEERWFRW